jgi:mono/diheme cytochrome c family protein
MASRARSILILSAAAGLCLAAPALAAEVCNPNQPLSGASLFADNCATCHGADATGGQTPSRVAAPDLTLLAQKAKGRFPAPRVADIIRYGGALPDHSVSKQMPVWSKIFYAECGPVYSRRVVVELLKFIQDRQK